jgi:hypothetical protein
MGFCFDDHKSFFKMPSHTLVFRIPSPPAHPHPPPAQVSLLLGLELILFTSHPAL